MPTLNLHSVLFPVPPNNQIPQTPKSNTNIIANGTEGWREVSGTHLTGKLLESPTDWATASSQPSHHLSLPHPRGLASALGQLDLTSSRLTDYTQHSTKLQAAKREQLVAAEARPRGSQQLPAHFPSHLHVAPRVTCFCFFPLELKEIGKNCTVFSVLL